MSRVIIKIVTLGWILSIWPSAFCSAQKHDYNWLFGYDSFNPFDTFMEFGGTDIDFNCKPPCVNRVEREMNIDASNASISDVNGQLLFYTNNCFVADRTHELMQNGDSLTPSNRRGARCPGGFRSVQSSIILPYPSNSDKYILFHNNLTLRTEPIEFFIDTMYFSMIDISLNNGYGVVLEKNNALIAGERIISNITACKHLDNTSWWIITQVKFDNQFLKILLTPEGISPAIKQRIGESDLDPSSGGGQSVFTPNGQHYLHYTPTNGVRMYDFNRSTGELSNYRQWEVPNNLPPERLRVGGLAISPNSRFAYATTFDQLWQYDLLADDIKGSEVLIDEYNGVTSPNFPSNFYQAQLAPDCRIYINSANGVNVLHVIHSPDEKGAACNFEQQGFALATYNSFAMPNNPNYRLGTGEVCDPTIVSTTEVIPDINEALFYPNPTRDIVYISEIGIAEIVLCDVSGREVCRYENPGNSIDLSHVDNGVYYMIWNNAEGIKSSHTIQVFR